MRDELWDCLLLFTVGWKFTKSELDKDFTKRLGEIFEKGIQEGLKKPKKYISTLIVYFYEK